MMSRRLLIAVFTASMALLLATLVAWIFSYYYVTLLAHQGKLWFICTGDHGIIGGFNQGDLDKVNPHWRNLATSRAEFAGIDFYHLTNLTVLGISFVYPFAVLLGCVVWCGARIRRQRRRERLGLCMQCGYDLRQTSGRCPECGSAAATPVAKVGHGG